jgi:hypothetical protein
VPARLVLTRAPLRSLSAVFGGPCWWERDVGEGPNEGGTQGSRADLLLRGLPYVSMAGLLGMVAVMALAFEEAQSTLVAVCAAVLFVAPAGLLIHLAVTKELGAREKAVWLRALLRRGGFRLASAYFRRQSRAAATRGLVRGATLTRAGRA